MAMELCILGSGSTGNATILRASTGTIMLDAGLGPRVTAKRLQNTGTRVDDVKAVVLTHLDSDHFSCNWVNTFVAAGVQVYVHASRVNHLHHITSDCGENTSKFAALIRPFVDTFEPLPRVTFSPLAFTHDQYGSHGFVIEHGDRKIGFATDLGRVPPYLVERFTGVDILAIESNYDPHMQVNSGRPRFLTDRIMGGYGHLSNNEAMTAVKAVFDRCEKSLRRLPSHVVLLHRSRDCNCPNLLREFFSKDPRIAPRLTLAEHTTPTGWLSPSPREPVKGEQMSLMFG